MATSGITPDGEWQPAFPSQRPPFHKGNKTARRHGANDPAVYGPLAEKIAARLRANPHPPWITHPLLEHTLREYAEHAAKAEILIDYLDEIHLPFCPCPGCQAEDDATKQRMAPRRNAACEAWTRATTRMTFLRRDLGGYPGDWHSPPPRATWVKAAQDMGYNIRRRPPGRPPKTLTQARTTVTLPPSPGKPATSHVTD